MRLLEEYELKGQMERERERNQIVEIIAKSRRPIAPFEIKDVLDKIGVYENQFPTGKGNNNSIEMTKESMSDRTIRYWCSELTKEGILQHDGEHNSYLISDKAAEELRHFGGIFGTEALYQLTTSLPIETTTADKSIAEFVNRFGALVVYAFIEAVRPFEDKTMSAEAKDKTALSWVRNAIPVEEMYNQFRAGFVSDIKKNDDDGNESSKYEFGREKVGELSESLQKAYPDIYESLLKARTYSLDRPTKQSMPMPPLTKQDFSRLKEAFCRCLCEHVHKANTRTFVAHRLFSESKMRDYMANEPALKPFMTRGDSFYRLVNSICTDLVMDRILELAENPDHGGREYRVTTNLIRLCHRLTGIGDNMIP